MKCGLIAAAVAGTGLAVAIALTATAPVPLSTVSEGLPCAAVPLDEFARMPGTGVDAVCALADGQAVHVVRVDDRRPFYGYLSAHPDLTQGYAPAWSWTVVGTPAALTAAGVERVTDSGEF